VRRRLLLIPFFLIAAAQGGDAALRILAPVAQAEGVPGSGCEDGLVLDDGTFETAYGWVPSVEWGEYVQAFQIGAAFPVVLESVCVCWTRTTDDDSLDFEIEVYEDVDGTPASEPLIVVHSSVAEVPEWEDGVFAEVPFAPDGPELKPGTYYIGARWNPSADQYFFICADQSNPAAPVPGFFRDDRSDGEWDSLIETSDPIFADHTALMIRVRGRQVRAVPAIGLGGACVFVLLILGRALVHLRRRRAGLDVIHTI